MDLTNKSLNTHAPHFAYPSINLPTVLSSVLESTAETLKVSAHGISSFFPLYHIQLPVKSLFFSVGLLLAISAFIPYNGLNEPSSSTQFPGHRFLIHVPVQ
jgi:hypothetical protein